MNIAIIGGGLSGTLLTYYLLEADTYPLTIYLFEKEHHQLSRGIAYRLSPEEPLLNVIAEKMDVHGMEPGSFYRWLCFTMDNKPSPGDFVPRSWFGRYLKELFQEKLEQSKNVHVKIITDEVIDIVKEEEIVKVCTIKNNEYRASNAVIANGILPPSDPFKLSMDLKRSGLYQSNPWDFHYQQQLKENDHVVLIGTGLTMLDHAACLLKSDKNFQITTLSRRGLLPLAHAPYKPYHFKDYAIVPQEDIGVLFRMIRTYYRNHKDDGLDWRCLIDRIRLQVPELWKSLNSDSKSRFIRHLKSYWEMHRHRGPQSVLNILHKANNEGRFKLLKGRILEVKCVNKTSFQITINNVRESINIQANYLLNSSGLQQNVKLTTDPLLKNLMQRGYILPDANGLGAETDDTGALHCFQNQKNIFALGALRRAALLECTAAKEIGEHAFKLSNHLLSLKFFNSRQSS